MLDFSTLRAVTEVADWVRPSLASTREAETLDQAVVSTAAKLLKQLETMTRDALLYAARQPIGAEGTVPPGQFTSSAGAPAPGEATFVRTGDRISLKVNFGGLLSGEEMEMLAALHPDGSRGVRDALDRVQTLLAKFLRGGISPGFTVKATATEQRLFFSVDADLRVGRE